VKNSFLGGPARIACVGIPLVLCASLLGCATPPLVTADPMCAQIRDFANATQMGAQHSVELVVAWFPAGGGDGRQTVAKADCTDAGYAPGRVLCRYMVQNSSREFPELNVERTLACMGNATDRNILKGLSVRALSGEIEALQMAGIDDDVRLTASFSVDRGGQAPVLRIAAQRRRLPD